MDSEKYNRTVSMRCATCAGTDFEFDPETDGPVRCVRCDRSYTREELKQLNADAIESAVSDVVSDVKKDLSDTLRKALGSSFKLR